MILATDPISLGMIVCLVVIAATLPRVAGWPIATAIAALGTGIYVGLEDPGVLVLTAVAGIAARLLRLRARDRSLGTFLLEGTAIATGLVLYMAGRAATEASYGEARANGASIVRFEQQLGTWFEPGLQAWAFSHDWLISAFNVIYLNGYFAFVIAVLVWLWLSDGERFRRLQLTLAVSAGLALITVIIFPVMPPRLLPGIPIYDTIAIAGIDRSYTNQYAALPSLHVGWLVLAGFALGRSAGGRIGGAIGLAPGALMAMTVIVTGNHYWFDAVLGSAYCLGAYAVLGRRTGTVPEPHPQPEPGLPAD